MAKIHSTAVVEDGAVLGADVEIGPFCFVGRSTRLGDGVRLVSHVAIRGDTEIGQRTEIHAQAVLRIGVNNVIRECVTMNGGTRKGGGITRVGDNGYFMAYSHVGHDCQIGNGATFANGVALAGHVTVADNVNIGGLAAVLQYVRIGRDAFVGGASGLPTDVIPYGLVQGSRAYLQGLNLIGLKRKGLARERIHALRNAFNQMFYGDGHFMDRVASAEERWGDSPEVAEIIAFIRAKSKRQICVPERSVDGYEGD
jgi:UDP-N-acetylglucosamine acyltransferase